MKYVTYIKTPEYLASLTATEKKVLEADRTLVVGHSDKDRAAKIGVSPSTYSRCRYSAQAKLVKYGKKEHRETK